MAIGRTVSAMVIVALAVLIFPFTSVTVKVTAFAPTLAQVKFVCDKANDKIPQASLLPLLT